MPSESSTSQIEATLHHSTYFLTFTEFGLTKRWLWKENAWAVAKAFVHPTTVVKAGKVYVFADETWPFYVGKTTRSVASRISGAFRCTPEKRVNGFAGYRFKHKGAKTHAFLHVFMGPLENPWTDRDAECIEAEVVFRIRQAGAWPAYQTEIHFSSPGPLHSAAADGIMAYFHRSKAGQCLNSPLAV